MDNNSKWPLRLLLLLSCLGSDHCFAARTQRAHAKEPAAVYEVRIPQRMSQIVHPVSHAGIILVALKDCVIRINGDKAILSRGQFRQIPGSKDTVITAESEDSAPLVVVNVKTEQQELTVEAQRLAPSQSLEDASDRNLTLTVAVSSVCLRDVVNLGDESAWRPSPPVVLRIRAGQTRWLGAGTHHLRNCGSQDAEFVTLEW